VPNPSCPVIASADYSTVTATSQQFAAIIAMAAGEFYVFTSTIDCWIQQGADPEAEAAAGSLYVPANTPTYLDGRAGVKLAVLRAGGSDGAASLARLAV
jgi:hypothetical protein